VLPDDPELMELMEMHSSMKPEALKVLLCEKHNKHTKRQDITNYRERMAEIERCKALPMLMRYEVVVVAGSEIVVVVEVEVEVPRSSCR